MTHARFRHRAYRRYTFRNADAHTRIRPVCDTGFNFCRIEGQFFVEHGIFPTLQGLPIATALSQASPFGAYSRPLMYSKVTSSGAMKPPRHPFQ